MRKASSRPLREGWDPGGPPKGHLWPRGIRRRALRTTSRQVVTYPRIEFWNSSSAKLKSRGVLVCNSRGAIVPLGVGAE